MSTAKSADLRFEAYTILSKEGSGVLLLPNMPDLPQLNFVTTGVTATPPFEQRTVEGWLDVLVGTRPERPSATVKLPGLTGVKRAWIAQRVKKRGTVFALVRLIPAKKGETLTLLVPGGALAGLTHPSEETLLEAAAVGWRGPVGGDLARYLVS